MNASLLLITLVFLNIQISIGKTTINIKQAFKPANQIEGHEANVMRIVGSHELRSFDPFILLDFFKLRLPSGFPDHPHRGVQLVTYLIKGSLLHEDFRGKKGVIKSGDVQWMTVGKGIVHCEMPGSFDEDSIGFQIWINLGGPEKMIDPFYQEYSSDKIKVWKMGNVRVKVIAGQYEDVQGIISTKRYIKFLDIHISKDQKVFEDIVDFGFNCLIFIYEGKVSIKNVVYSEQTAIIIESIITPSVEFMEVKSETPISKFILICAQPLREMVYNKGAFVMDSNESLEQAEVDFKLGQNGFEGANTWSSSIKDLPKKRMKEQQQDKHDDM